MQVSSVTLRIFIFSVNNKVLYRSFVNLFSFLPKSNSTSKSVSNFTKNTFLNSDELYCKLLCSRQLAQVLIFDLTDLLTFHFSPSFFSKKKLFMSI